MAVDSTDNAPQAQLPANSTDSASGSNPRDPLLSSITRQAAWWIASVLFHGVVLILACMGSMLLNGGNASESLVTVTKVERADGKSALTSPARTGGRAQRPGDRCGFNRSVEDRGAAGDSRDG